MPFIDGRQYFDYQGVRYFYDKGGAEDTYVSFADSELRSAAVASGDAPLTMQQWVVVFPELRYDRFGDENTTGYQNYKAQFYTDKYNINGGVIPAQAAVSSMIANLDEFEDTLRLMNPGHNETAAELTIKVPVSEQRIETIISGALETATSYADILPSFVAELKPAEAAALTQMQLYEPPTDMIAVALQTVMSAGFGALAFSGTSLLDVGRSFLDSFTLDVAAPEFFADTLVSDSFAFADPFSPDVFIESAYYDFAPVDIYQPELSPFDVLKPAYNMLPDAAPEIGLNIDNVTAIKDITDTPLLSVSDDAGQLIIDDGYVDIENLINSGTVPEIDGYTSVDAGELESFNISDDVNELENLDYPDDTFDDVAAPALPDTVKPAPDITKDIIKQVIKPLVTAAAGGGDDGGAKPATRPPIYTQRAPVVNTMNTGAVDNSGKSVIPFLSIALLLLAGS